MKRFVFKPAIVLWSLVAMLGTCLAAHAAETTPEPVQVIEQFAKDLLKNLEANRATYQQDAAPLRKMVDQYMRPKFDVEFAAQRILTQQWATANATQRSRFVEAFYQSVLQSYSGAIRDLTAEQLAPLPFRPEENPDLAEVRYEVRKPNSPAVPVSYLLRRADGNWKIWDLKVESISYVKAYQFRMVGDIQKLGLDGAIERLEGSAGIGAGAEKK